MRQRLRLLPADRPAAIMALHAEQLEVVFQVAGKSVSVIERIDFSVAPGELICLLGPSGCGKTTLLSLVAGFLFPSSGSLSVYGRPVTQPGPDRCVVFQEDALFPWLTVAENVAFGLKGRLSGKALRDEVAHHLELVGLSSFGNYLPGEISGGMKQRVALARVLILKPLVLLMDEPFGALDAQTREEMQQLLLTLWREFSPTILFVTHDINEALVLADRILVMARHPGRIAEAVAIGMPHPRTKASEAFNRLYGKLRALL
jgi:NitT/TauT family transport system ATP-binding protein